MKNVIKKTAERRGIVTSSFYLQNVKRVGLSPFSGGGFSDVWMGLFDGESVVLKVLRFYEENDSRSQASCKICRCNAVHPINFCTSSIARRP